MTSEGYTDYWLVFKQKNIGRVDVECSNVVVLLNKLNACESIRSILSIGHGEGELDMMLINKHLKNVEQFYGVDLRKSAGEIIRKKLSNTTNHSIKTHLATNTIQDYEGPGSHVDLILINHVMYYVIEEFIEVMDRVLTWLAPGGCLIMNHADPDHYKILYKGEKLLGNRGVRWSQYTEKRDQCYKHLKDKDWTVEDYSVPYGANHDASDNELRELLKLQFGTPISDSELEQLKELVKDEALEGTRGYIPLLKQTVAIYKTKF